MKCAPSVPVPFPPPGSSPPHSFLTGTPAPWSASHVICHPNHVRIKREKLEFLKDDTEYLGFDVEYGCWKRAASPMQPLQDMQICDDPGKGLQDVTSFVGACNVYCRYFRNITYSSARLTDLIKKTTPWRWYSREVECFEEL